MQTHVYSQGRFGNVGKKSSHVLGRRTWILVNIKHINTIFSLDSYLFEQGYANYSPWAKSSILLCFWKQFIWDTAICIFTLQWEGWVDAKRLYGSQSLKYLLPSPLYTKFANLCFRQIKYNFSSISSDLCVDPSLCRSQSFCLKNLL